VSELDKIILEIRDIKKDFSEETFQTARFGYRCWIKTNRDKSIMERLKFMRDYFKTYENQC